MEEQVFVDRDGNEIYRIPCMKAHFAVGQSVTHDSIDYKVVASDKERFVYTLEPCEICRACGGIIGGEGDEACIGHAECKKKRAKEPKPKLYYILSWKWSKRPLPSQSYHEEFVWYAPNANGYTKYLCKAGKFTEEEARGHECIEGPVKVTQAIPCEEAALWAKPVVEATAAAVARFEKSFLPALKKEATNGIRE